MNEKYQVKVSPSPPMVESAWQAEIIPPTGSKHYVVGVSKDDVLKRAGQWVARHRAYTTTEPEVYEL
jgi:hypothetical protein